MEHPMPHPSILAQPLTLKTGAVLPNRFMKAATSEQLGNRQHNPKPGLAKLYKTWSQGGAGLLISGNIMVDRTALGEPFNVVLDGDSDLDAFRQWTAAARVDGNHFWAQINHPGKQSPKVLSPEPVAPSAIPLDGALAAGFNTPRALSDSEITTLIASFAKTAELAKTVGFTGVQIHGAHGYLVSQFLSPKHNTRQDRWGGTAENRMRFVLEIYRAIRARVGADFPVAIKLNSADFQKGGFTEEESMQVAEALVSEGLDHIEISGGSYEQPVMMAGTGKAAVKQSTQAREAYFLHYAEALRARCDVPLAVTGGFRSAQGMEAAVASGATDMVGLARPIILVPDLPKQVLASSEFKIDVGNPTTGKPKIDAISMLGIVWYEKQMWRLAQGRKTKLNLSPWMAVVSSFWKVMSKPAPRRA